VRRHQVTNALGLPAHPFFARKGATTAVSPPCMSTTVPYWSNMQPFTVSLIAAATVLIVIAPRAIAAEAQQIALRIIDPIDFYANNIHVVDGYLMNLRAIDLNLLVALDALLTERHVSRAA